ncbi:MAG: DUF6377 domain-containing protein [Bacteroidales bacterium]|nr:DUF6377 domain-containing protein [Bacteroidales bacterium]
MYDNICIAKELNNPSWLTESKLSLIRHYSTEGLYLDAVRALDSIRPQAYKHGLLTSYYSVYKQLYLFYSASNDFFPPEYFLYQDSLLMATDKNSNVYPFLVAEKLSDTEHSKEARDILLPLFDAAEEGSHLQAMLANSIGRTYRGENNYEMQKKYFALSAIGDVKNAVREHESFRSLAIACYQTNDIERAYKYISQSMEDAIFTNFNMRMIEASQFFPIIEKSYQQKLEKEKNRFFYLAILTGVIAVFLIIGIIYIYRQMNKLAAIRKSLSDTNAQLNQINEEAVNMNRELSESNLLKETYITQFLHVCSLYVKKMEKYQSLLNKKAMDRQLEDLYKILKSRDMIDNELKELYGLFDKIFLNLYPNFVEELNKLLPDEEQFKLKKDDSMTAELRMLALIRLGITDSSAIAEFLHYSIKTIYNYRTRLRNKALVRSEDFENEVKKIGKHFN